MKKRIIGRSLSHEISADQLEQIFGGAPASGSRDTVTIIGSRSGAPTRYDDRVDPITNTPPVQ